MKNTALTSAPQPVKILDYLDVNEKDENFTNEKFTKVKKKLKSSKKLYIAFIL